jgi:maleate isomerase
VRNRVLLGMLTPSSNSVLEPVSSAKVAVAPEISVHFGLFRVTEIALNERALAQFDDGPRLEEAGLLADARVKAICWNGMSAGWLGFDTDRALCPAIERRTGVAASSSVLSLADAFRCTGVESYGLVAPYSDDIQAKILSTFRKEGFDCVAERHLGISDNYSFSEVPPDRPTATVREVAEASSQAIPIFCTNLRGAPLVENLERDRHSDLRHDRDGVWGAMRIAGADPRVIRYWGRLFREVTPLKTPRWQNCGA